MTVGEVRGGAAVVALGIAVFTLFALIVEGEWACCPSRDTRLGLAPAVVGVGLLIAEAAAGVAVGRGLIPIGGASWGVAVGLSWVLAPLYSLIHVIVLCAVVAVMILREHFFSSDARESDSDAGSD